MRCSVVIPTYNRKESLHRTLEALSKQTLPTSEFEVVVVSDGSTDGTDALLSEYTASGKIYLRSFTQQNAGPAAARNLGIEQAQGEIIVFIDDDVEPVAYCLERHLAHHEQDEKAVVLGPLSPNPRWTNEEPVWIVWEHAKLQSIYTMFQTGQYAGCPASYMHFYSGNASVRKHWLVEVGGFNVEFKRQEDVELAERLKRLCGVNFCWDFVADGLHHPVRTLDSWLKIPSAYGTLDAERVRAGTLKDEHVANNLAKRHGATRMLTQLCLAAPPLISPASLLMCGSATALFKLRIRGAALAMLSAVYNARYTAAYLSGMRGSETTRPAASAS